MAKDSNFWKIDRNVLLTRFCRAAQITALLAVSLLCNVMTVSASGETRLPEASSGEATAFRHVTDHMGRDVAMPLHPKRIVALNPLVMESLFAIGLAPIAKVDEYSIREEGKNLTSVGNLTEINIERIHEVTPDLILAHKRNHGQFVQALEQTGAPVYVFDPGKFGDNPMLSVYEFFGELLGKHAEAKAYVTSIYALAENLREDIRSKIGLTSGIIIKPGDRVCAAQNATFYGSIINALGLENIVQNSLSDGKKDQFITIDAETILTTNPDFIFILAAGPDVAQNEITLRAFCDDPKWRTLGAVKKGHVKVLPFNVGPNKSSPEQALRLAAQQVLESSK